MGDKNKIRKIALGVLFLACAVLLVLIVKKAGDDKLVVVLDFGTDKKSFQVSIEDKERAWGLLQQASVLANTDLEATNDFRPKKIDGMANGDNNKQWVFYVNGVKQEASPFDTFINPPAEVVFKFE